jgi:RNA polymerase sigma-70 factor, ECF subfamily
MLLLLVSSAGYSEEDKMSETTSVEGLEVQALFADHYDRIRRYILSMVRDPAEADDLTQDAFLRAYSRYSSLRDAGALTTWLYRIATHVCLDRLRQRTRRRPMESGEDPNAVDLADPGVPSLQQAVEQEEMSSCVQRYIEQLPDSYRSVILLHDLHELTGPEIAGVLGESLATVKIRLHRARRRLQSSLEGGCTFSRNERDVLVCEPRPPS